MICKFFFPVWNLYFIPLQSLFSFKFFFKKEFYLFTLVVLHGPFYLVVPSGSSLQLWCSREHGLQESWLPSSRAQTQQLLVHKLSCPTARGILSDQGSKPVSCTGRWIFYYWATGKPPESFTEHNFAFSCGPIYFQLSCFFCHIQEILSRFPKTVSCGLLENFHGFMF